MVVRVAEKLLVVLVAVGAVMLLMVVDNNIHDQYRSHHRDENPCVSPCPECVLGGGYQP